LLHRPHPDGETPNAGIAIALATHNVRDCEQYFYRAASDNSEHVGLSNDEEYLVYCKTMDTQVDAYVVFVRPGKDEDVVGPATPADGIPFPKFCCADDPVTPPKAGSYPP